MAEQDLSFTVGVDTTPFVAEVQRVIALMRDAGASVNLTQPFDAGAQAARRAYQDFRAVTLELANIERSSERVGETYSRQQIQLRKVEEAIRTIRNLPITSQAQFKSLTDLEKIQTRLNANIQGGIAIDPATFQGVQTAIARFIGELKNAEIAELQLIDVSKLLQRTLNARYQLDPSFSLSLVALREQILATGPVARNAFRNITEGAEATIVSQERAARSTLTHATALTELQRAGQGVARGEQEMARAILARGAAAEKASVEYDRFLTQQQRLLLNIAKLQGAAAGMPGRQADLLGQVAAMGGASQDPRQLTEMVRQYHALKAAIDQVIGAERELRQQGELMVRAEQEAAAAFRQRASARERADAEYERALIRQANLLARISRLPISPQRTDLQGRVQAAAGLPSQDPRALNALNLEYLTLKQSVDGATASIAKSGGTMKETTSIIDRMSTRLGNHLQIVASIGVAYTAFNALTAVVDHFVQLDAVMHRISATMADQQERTTLLPRAYDLIQQGMTRFGLSTEDAGKLVLELTRSLSDLTQVNAAFEPALALTVRGEVTMAEATKVLIGSVNAFGASLLGVQDPLDAFGAAADKIIRASNLSVGSIGTFSAALTNLAGRASVTNTTFDETLAALSLVQDSLGRAGQSGTGLARVFEGLLLRADQLAEMFDIKFDPARAVNPIDLLSQAFAKLREEIRLTGGISSETEAKIQKIIGTEQGTRIIELLVKDWEKFPARLKQISESTGQHQKELAEHNAQLGVSFKNLTNSALVAVDSMLVAFSKLGGGGGDSGAPGQFRTLAAAFNTIAAGFIQFGKTIEEAAESIQKFITAIANLRPPPDWLNRMISASPAPAASAIAIISNDLNKLGKEMNVLPEPPDWLMRMLGFGASIAGGAALGSVIPGVGTLVGGLAGGGSFLLTQYSLDAQAALRDAEKLTKAANAAARAMTIQSGHDPAALGDQAAQAEADVERNRARILKERLALLKELETTSANEIRQRSGAVSAIEQITAATANATKSEREYQAARAKFADDQELSRLGEKDQAAAFEKLSQLKRKSVTDQNEVNALQKTYAAGQKKQDEEMAAIYKGRSDALQKIQRELEALGATDPISQIFVKAQQHYDDLYKELQSKGLPGFGDENKGLLEALKNAQINVDAKKLYEGLTVPFRDAADANYEIVAKLITDTEKAYAQLGNRLSLSQRDRLKETPDRAIDKQLGADKIQRDLREASAVLGKFGEEAAKAVFAATNNFASFDQMVVTAVLDMESANTTLTRMIDRFTKMRGEMGQLNIDQVARSIELGAKAIEEAFDISIAIDPVTVEANVRALQRTEMTLKELGESADATHRKLAAMLVIEVKQDFALPAIKQLNTQLADLTVTNSNTIASFGLVGEAAVAAQIKFGLMAKGVDVTSEAMQRLITRVAEAIQQQKSLETMKGLMAIGFSESAAKDMAAAITKQDELNKTIDEGTAALHRYQDQGNITTLRNIANLTRQNQAAEVAYKNQLELAKQTAIEQKDYFAFLSVSFSQAATQGHSFFEDLDTLARNTASNMKIAFSDIFFSVFQGNIKDAQAAFKNFMLSILREITNTMASQAVKGLLGLFGIKSSGGGLDLSGLFGGGNTQPGGAPDPTPFALAGPTTGGGITAGSMPGFEVEQDMFSSVKFGQAATTLLDTASSMSKSAGVWNAITSGWAAGEGVFGGIAGAASKGFDAMNAAFSGMTAVVSYAAAVIQGVLIIMDDTKSDLGKAIQTATLAVGAAFAPWTAGLSLIAAGIINWIEDLFGLFDKGISSYTQKRIDAGEQANRGMKSVTEGYQRATTSGDPNTVLQSLRAKSEGIGTILLATPELAARLGLDVSKTGTQEGKFEVSWDDVTLSQFQELLRVLGRDEATAEGIVAGRAFVGYLPQEQVEAVQKQMSEIAIAMLKAFVAFTKVREEVNQLVIDIQDIVEDFLPPDLAASFKKNLLDPIRQQIIDVVQSGMPLADVTARLGNLKATLAAYVNLVSLYGQLTQDFAAFSGDFVNSMDYVDKQIKQSRETANKRIVTAAKDVGLGADLVDPTSGNLLDVTDAIEKVKKAFAEMDLTPVMAFEKLSELRTAVIERFELEKKLVTEAEASISKLYSEHVAGIAALYTAIEQMNTAITGSDTGLNSMIQTLIRIGTTSLSVSESLWAVNTALDIFIKTLPTRIAGKAGRPDDPTLGVGALPVDQILAATLGVVQPFAATLNREIRNAFDAGDFETAFHLLQQLGSGLKSAMDAAIAGVRQWEAAQISVINNEADRRIREAGKVRDMYQKQLDKERELVEEKLDAIRKQKDAIQDQRWAIEDTIQSIRDQMRPLEDQIKAITRQQELLRRSMRPIDAAIRAIGDLMRPIQAQLDALDERAELAQQVADDQLWNISLQTYALEQQRDTIQDEIDLIEEMANAVLGVRDYLLDLALSQQAPPDAIGQFQIAQSSFDQLFAAYQADPTAEGLIKLQEAAQRLFGALGPLFERPSAEYRALYEEIVKKLEAAAAIGANIADPARLEDLVDQLELVDEKLEDLNDAADLIAHNLELELHAIELLKRPLEDQLKEYQDQIDALNLIKDRIQRQIELLEEQKEPIQDLLDLGQDYIDNLNLQLEKLGRAEELLGRTETTLNRDLARIADNQDILNQLYQDYVDSINTLRDEAIDATEKAADDIIASIEKEMMPLMTAVGWDAHHFYEWMRNEQYARLMDLTSGQGTAAWMKTAQENTATWINAIRTALDVFLQGDMQTVMASIKDKSVEERMIETLTNLDGSIGTLNNYLVTQGANPPVPAATPPPDNSPGGSAQGGARYTHQGIYQLHEGEMVVPSAEAEALRASTESWSSLSRLANGGGEGMSITIAPVIHSNQNPAAIANQVVDRIIVDIRGGGAIQDAIARMPKRSR